MNAMSIDYENTNSSKGSFVTSLRKVQEESTKNMS